MLSPTRKPFLLLLLALAGAALSSPLAIRRGPKAACAAVMVVFARGTGEIGPFGTVVGPPFFEALKVRVGRGNVKFEGVPYPADVGGFLVGGSPLGSAMMAKMVGDTVAACPGSKVVMSGYSQGGQLVHNAAKSLAPAVSGGVAGAVIFGDPGEICGFDSDVCCCVDREYV